jgi:hypothetical protein
MMLFMANKYNDHNNDIRMLLFPILVRILLMNIGCEVQVEPDTFSIMIHFILIFRSYYYYQLTTFDLLSVSIVLKALLLLPFH